MSAASLPRKANSSLSMAEALVRSPGRPSQAVGVAGSSWGRQKTSWKWAQLLSSATARPGERGTQTPVFQEQQC